MKHKLLLSSASILLLALSAGAQQDRGTFTGTVTDPTGAVVPGVRVLVTQVQTNLTVDTSTNETGQYRVPNLPIGEYRITFEAKGFKTSVREGLRLSVTDVVRVDGHLEVGALTESLTLTAEAPLLQTETPEVGTVLGTRQVIDLPLGFSGGRYAENFAYKLTAGVSGNNWMSYINGAPAFSKEIVLDGASATVYIAGHMGESSPSMEALEEFKIQTSGMSAEFTRTAGGVFNFVMKSGTNRLHGSGMGQIHNEWADANTFARNFYCGQGQAANCSPRRDRRNNYAFSLGGPVTIPKIVNGRDRWFWHAAYEKYNESFAGGGSPVRTVPLPQWYDGNLGNYLTPEKIGTDAEGRDVFRGAIYDPASSRTVGGRLVRDMFPGNIIPVARFSTVSKNLINIMKTHYLPEVKDASGNYPLLNNAFFPVSNQAGFDQTQFSTKSDYHLTTRQRISGSFVFVDRPRTLLDQGGVWDFSDPNGGPLSRARRQYVASHYVRLAHDYTLRPNMLNHVLVAYNRQINPSTSQHVDEPGGQMLGIKGIVQDANYPEIAGLIGDRVSFPTLGYQANDLGAATAYQLVDTFSWMKGRHSLKFGLDYRWNGLNWRNNAGPGQINFGAAITGLPGFNQTGHGFASMLLGAATSASVNIDTPTGSQFPMWSWFVQDDWKVTPRLTMNVGLRWDFQSQGTEKYDRLHNFNTELVDPLYGIMGAVEFAGVGPGRNGERTFYPNNLNTTWGPRVGFAYQLPEHLKMTLRGGYGIFYNPRIPNGWSGVPWGNKSGFTATSQMQQTVPDTPGFYWDNGYTGVVRQAERDPSMAAYLWGPVGWDPDGGRVGYTQQWNFNVQRELPFNMVFDIGYIGTKSTGILANEMRRITQLPYQALQLGDVLGNWVADDASIPASVKALGGKYPYGNKGEWIPMWQTLTPYPTVIYWSSVYSWNSPLGFSNYQALQVQLNKRFSRGLQFTSNYTRAKTLGNVSSAFGDTWGQNWGRPLDYYNLSLEKSVLEFDQRHIVKIGVSYDLPVGRGRAYASSMPRWLEFIAGGWTLQYIGNYSSGMPVNFGATATPNSNFATNRPFVINPNGESMTNANFDRSNFQMTDLSVAGPGKTYFNTAMVVDPVKINRYARGNAPRLMDQLRGFASYNEDTSLQKNYVPKEGIRLQFRAEFLNVFNRHRFTGFNTTPASPLFGQISGVSDDRRQIQFGIRGDF